MYKIKKYNETIPEKSLKELEKENKNNVIV